MCCPCRACCCYDLNTAALQRLYAFLKYPFIPRDEFFCYQGSITFLFKGTMHEKFFICLFTHSFTFTRIKRSLKTTFGSHGKISPRFIPVRTMWSISVLFPLSIKLCCRLTWNKKILFWHFYSNAYNHVIKKYEIINHNPTLIYEK